ncbi:MAG: hypothetical protein ACKV2V_13675 [Blastocatellia bacterium]
MSYAIQEPAGANAGSHDPHATYTRMETLLALGQWFADRGNDEVALSPTRIMALSNFDKAEERALRQARDGAMSTAERSRRAERLVDGMRAVAPDDRALLESHIHPARIAAALGDEPAGMRVALLRMLPEAMAAGVAAVTGLRWPLAGGRVARHDARLRACMRRHVMRPFVLLRDLTDVTPLDCLSGEELVRLTRLLGIREIALACRGIPDVESLSAFLGRFTESLALEIGRQIGRLVTVEPARVEFAQHLLATLLREGVDHAALIDGAGMALLAIALNDSPPAHVRLTMQKLAPGLAQTLGGLIHVWRNPPGAGATRTECMEMAARLLEARGG